MLRPNTNEYPPFYQGYLNLLPEGDFSSLLAEDTANTIQLFNDIAADKHEYRYAEGKWTIKDVLMHIIDTERGFSYRMIVCLRKDGETMLHPMDEDMYAANANTSARTMASLLEEFIAVRESARIMLENSSEDENSFMGNGAGHRVTARALGYIMIGHAIHHVNVVKERYL
tara:strand:+ start:303 stop:815 length:513 start_codon:yes stop_codon:yes gene_type:complete